MTIKLLYIYISLMDRKYNLPFLTASDMNELQLQNQNAAIIISEAVYTSCERQSTMWSNVSQVDFADTTEIPNNKVV